MEIPAPDASKLLQSWMEWERGDVTPGRVMSNLKTGGMRQLLEDLAELDGRAPTPPVGALAEDVAVGPAAGSGGPADNVAAGPTGPAGGPPPWAPVV